MRLSLGRIATALISFFIATTAASAAPLLDEEFANQAATNAFQDAESKRRGAPDFQHDEDWRRTTQPELQSLQNLLSQQVKSLSHKVADHYQQACDEGTISPGTNRTIYIFKELAEDAFDLASYAYHIALQYWRPALQALGNKLPEWQSKWDEFNKTPLGRVVSWSCWLFGPSLGFIQVPLALLIKAANGALSVPYVMWALLRWMLPISASVTLFPFLLVTYFFLRKRSSPQPSTRPRQLPAKKLH